VVADTLSKLGSNKSQAPPDVFVQELYHPGIPQDSGEECKSTQHKILLTEQDPTD
jgi:hypothetical protein